MMPLNVLAVLLACLLSYYLGSCSAVFSAFVVQPVQSQSAVFNVIVCDASCPCTCKIQSQRDS